MRLLLAGIRNPWWFWRPRIETPNISLYIYIPIEILLQIYPKPTMIWYIPICRPKYPLVNVYIAIENGHRNNELSHKNCMVIFHICCMFTRGYYMVWPQNKWEYINKYHNAIIWYISLYELFTRYISIIMLYIISSSWFKFLGVTSKDP